MAVSGLYFVYGILIDLAIGSFVRQTARKNYERAKRNKTASAEHLRRLKEILEEIEREDSQALADSWRQWKKARNKEVES